VAKIVTLVCWGVVVVTWSVGALYRARNAQQKRRGSGAALWAFAAVAGAIFIVHFAWNDLRRLTDHSVWLELPGLVLLVVSTVFTIWARLSLGHMWSASPNVLQEHHELKTEGPYAVTRHPIYTGLLGMVVGSALLNGLGVWLAVIFVGAVFLAPRIAIEERLMNKTFPDEYGRYSERVPRLVPGLRVHRRSH